MKIRPRIAVARIGDKFFLFYKLIYEFLYYIQYKIEVIRGDAINYICGDIPEVGRDRLVNEFFIPNYKMKPETF